MKDLKDQNTESQNASMSDEEILAFAKSLFAKSLEEVTNLTVSERIVHESGDVKVNKVKVVKDPDIVKAKDGFTLVDVIAKIFVEKANSRQIRYELYTDKERTKPHLEFKRACHTLAFLAKLPNSDSKIEIVDEFGYVTEYTPKQYEVPLGVLYDLVNFSGKVYLNDIARGLRKWLTTNTVESGHDDALVQTPSELATFLKHFDSYAQDHEKWNTSALDKKEIPFSSLAYVKSQVGKGKEFILHKFQDDNAEGRVKLYVTVLRGIECKTLQDYSIEVTPISVTDYIHNAVYGIANPQ